MSYFYEYRRLPFADPQEVCDALMAFEDSGCEVFQLELQPNGREYLVYLRKPMVIEGAKYFIIETTKHAGITFQKGDYFKGLSDGKLEHINSGLQFEFTTRWKGKILIFSEIWK